MSRTRNPGTEKLCASQSISSFETEVSKYHRHTLLGGSAALPPWPDQAQTGVPQGREAYQNEARYVGKRELDRRYPVSDMTRWRWMNNPKVGFPRPVKLGPNGRNFWWLPEILEWERRRAANSPSRRDA